MNCQTETACVVDEFVEQCFFVCVCVLAWCFMFLSLATDLLQVDEVLRQHSTTSGHVSSVMKSNSQHVKIFPLIGFDTSYKLSS